jgi:hypothetical protein
MELEAQAAYPGPDESQNAPGKHLLVDRSIDEDYRQVTYNAWEVEVCSARTTATSLTSPLLLLHHRHQNRSRMSTGSSPGMTMTVVTAQKDATTSPSIASFLFEFGSLFYKLARNRMKSAAFCVSEFLLF